MSISVAGRWDRLEALGIDDQTAAVLMSDNGGFSTSEGSSTFNFPLRGGKGWLYEGDIREPFIIRWRNASSAVTPIMGAPPLFTGFEL